MKPSIALIHPYWDFWASAVPGDLLADKNRLLEEATAVLANDFEIVASVLLSNPLEGAAVAETCANLDAIVVISSMAVPPATGMAVLEGLSKVPIVIWTVCANESLPDDFSHSDITTDGATVGTPMLGSALSRIDRPFDLVVSTVTEAGNIRAAVRRAAAAGRTRRAHIVRIGKPIPGFTTVEAPSGALSGFGPTMVEVAPVELAQRMSSISLERADEILDQIKEEFNIADNVDQIALLRAARTEASLRDIVAENNAFAGALNCHVSSLRPDPAFGIAPCLALGRMTSDGIPWTCTGDILTSVAMLVVQSLGHPSLYHEIEALDNIRNEAILANSGEHDIRLRGKKDPDLVPNVWYEHDPLTAPCARFSLPAGPASLVAFVYAPEPRFVVAEGVFTGGEMPKTGTPNAGFRFASGEVREAWARWAQAGVLHHSVATNAHIADDVKIVAHHLGASFWRI